MDLPKHSLQPKQSIQNVSFPGTKLAGSETTSVKDDVKSRATTVATTGHPATAPLPLPAKEVVPGISYVPDKLELDEDPSIVKKVLAELVDFIDCVQDLLQLMQMTNRKLLESPNPLPFDVIREIRVYGSRRATRLRAYETSISTGRKKSRTSSMVDNQPTRGSITSSNTNTTVKGKTTLHKHTQKKLIATELQEIVGKKQRPLWHVVAQEKREPSIVSVSRRKNNRLVDAISTGNDKQNSAKGKQQSVPVLKTKSQTILDNIICAKLCDAQPSNERYKSQVDMLEAYFAGFKSVSEHKLHLASMKPHWFTSFLKSVGNAGLLNYSSEVIEAFQGLGRFYEVEFEKDRLSKAKLCYIVQSLPMWDVTRITMQRATEFILKEILKEQNSEKVLAAWVGFRRLPYVVIPPIVSVPGGSMVREPVGETEVDEKKEDTISNVSRVLSNVQ